MFDTLYFRKLTKIIAKNMLSKSFGGGHFWSSVGA